MLTLVFPCTIKKSIPNLNEPVDRTALVKVFRENNNASRSNFFSDPLIKHLWTRVFIEENPEVLVRYLRRVRSQDNMGEAKYSRYIRDMKQLEEHLSCKLLPDIARDSANITAFTEREKCDDMLENAKNHDKPKDIFKIVRVKRNTDQMVTEDRD